LIPRASWQIPSCQIPSDQKSRISPLWHLLQNRHYPLGGVSKTGGQILLPEGETSRISIGRGLGWPIGKWWADIFFSFGALRPLRLADRPVSASTNNRRPGRCKRRARAARISGRRDGAQKLLPLRHQRHQLLGDLAVVICQRIIFCIHTCKFFLELFKTTFFAFAESALPVDDDALVPRSLRQPRRRHGESGRVLKLTPCGSGFCVAPSAILSWARRRRGRESPGFALGRRLLLRNSTPRRTMASEWSARVRPTQAHWCR